MSSSGEVTTESIVFRQRTNYKDSLNNFVTRKESPNNELIRRSDDRKHWKAMIADVCNRPGTWWWWFWQLMNAKHDLNVEVVWYVLICQRHPGFIRFFLHTNFSVNVGLFSYVGDCFWGEKKKKTSQKPREGKILLDLLWVRCVQ